MKNLQTKSTIPAKWTRFKTICLLLGFAFSGAFIGAAQESAYQLGCSKHIPGKMRENQCLTYALALGQALDQIGVPSRAYLVGQTPRSPSGPIVAHVFVAYTVIENGRKEQYVVDNIASAPITPLFTNDPVQWYYQLAQVPVPARRACGLHLIASFAVPPKSPTDIEIVSKLEKKNKVFNTAVPGPIASYHHDTSWGSQP